MAKVKNPSLPESDTSTGWTFLTNHTHVLVCLNRDPNITVRNLALHVGITERSVQRILSDLEDSGVVTRTKIGRRNNYSLNEQYQLRHPLESDQKIGGILALLE